jgi:thiamine-phosphate pyrophosphorylase
MIVLPHLYAIADSTFGDPVALARELFDGGATIVQVRNKTVSARGLLNQVLEILEFAPANCRVLVNDRVDVALASGAAGVHIGQMDLPPHMVRPMLPASQIIGYSTHNLQQALKAALAPVDYIAVGPIFPTSTKKDADPVVGLDGLREICSRVELPVVAIGGITLERAQDVFHCGASSVAVVSDLLNSKDVARRTQEWMRYNFEVCGRASTSTL